MAWQPIKKDGTPAKKPGVKPNPNKPKREPKFFKGVPRPHVWICGPDEYKHQMYTPWMMARAQANFRGEVWDLTFEEFFKLWDGHWEQRGREVTDLCMSRKDWKKPWDKKNCVIITRQEHFINQGLSRKGNFKKLQYTKIKANKNGD